MGKKLICFCLIFFVPFMIFSAEETGADILKEKTGARPLALGEAYTSSANDIEGIPYNPATVGFIKSREIAGAYLWKSFQTSIINAAYAQPIEIFFLEGIGGISFIYRSIPEIANVDATDAPVNFYDILLTATFANNLYHFIKNDFLKSINAGLSIKFIQEQIGDNVGSTFAFDFGCIFSPDNSNYRIGFSLLNAGAPIKTLRSNAEEGDVDYGASPLPLTLRLGGSYALKIDKDNTTNFEFDYVQNFYEASQFAFGIEHSIINVLFLRLGYNMYTDTRNPSTFSAGVGISVMTKVPVPVTCEINYVYRLFMWNWFNSPDSTNAVSMVFKF
ncbi:MAG: PorV/PorQ family protein [Candidatus Goldbacteria bacterium]|nr:PorV/PorQ family protein [Candidatus Goldiibacteriota bacterium]